MSRSEVELQKRVDILVKTIEKEIEAESKAPKTKQSQMDDMIYNEDVEMAS